MHPFLRHFALTAVLLHMIGGCCWHHAHAVCMGCFGPERHEHTGCTHEAEHHASPGDQPSAPAGDEHHDHRSPCIEGHCVFVPPETDNSIERITSSHAPAVPCAHGAGAFSSEAELRLQGAPPPVDRLPVRLHLLHQVLLV